MLALTLGVAFCFLQPTLLKKGLCLTSAFLGLAVIFLAHVRVLLLLGAGSIAIYTVVLILQNHVARVLALVKLGLVISVIGWSIAMSFGGQSVRDRFASLIEDDPLTVYDKSQRGTMLKGAFDTLIWEYPLGAGLGRWGMVRKYFGDESNVASPSIWAELQYPAWIIDGGVVLLVCYCVALIVTATEQLSIALNSESPRLRDIAAVVVALSAATIATTFGGVPFVTPQGMQFWFLAGALYGVWMRGPDQKRRLRPIAGAMS